MPLFVDKKTLVTERKEEYIALDGRKKKLKALKADGWYAVTVLPQNRGSYVTFERKVPYKMSHR